WSVSSISAAYRPCRRVAREFHAGRAENGTAMHGDLARESRIRFGQLQDAPAMCRVRDPSTPAPATCSPSAAPYPVTGSAADSSQRLGLGLPADRRVVHCLPLGPVTSPLKQRYAFLNETGESARPSEAAAGSADSSASPRPISPIAPACRAVRRVPSKGATPA